MQHNVHYQTLLKRYSAKGLGVFSWGGGGQKIALKRVRSNPFQGGFQKWKLIRSFVGQGSFCVGKGRG